MYLIILLMSLGVLAIAIIIITEMNDSKAKRKRLYIGLFSIVIFLNVLIFNYKISLTSMVGMDNSSYIHEVVISRFGQKPMVISDQKFLKNEMYGLLNKVEVKMISRSGPVKFEEYPYGISLSYNHHVTGFFLTNNLLQYKDKYYDIDSNRIIEKLLDYKKSKDFD